MKIMLLTASLAASFMLGGCATAQRVSAEDLDGKVVCDEQRMIAIEREAHRNFTQVRWMSCPTATIRVVRK
ncbi:MAG: hypothetical protein M3Z31_11095 [Pseudomonadota bacterium]|nr:hypothetical protein [Pseudomonadota bacterium]